MEEAADLGDYLPLSFNSPNEQEYVAFYGTPSRPTTLMASTSSSFSPTTCLP